jgi:hypothetical protein
VLDDDQISFGDLDEYGLAQSEDKLIYLNEEDSQLDVTRGVLFKRVNLWGAAGQKKVLARAKLVFDAASTIWQV